jgi:hypothetical protein
MEKLELLKMVSSVFKGITVETFNERFGALTADEVYFYVEEQKRLIKRYSVTEKGVARIW